MSPAREGQVKPPSLSAGSQPLCRSWSGQLQECSDGSYASPSTTGTFGFSASHGICSDKTSLPYFGVKLSCVSLMFAYRKKRNDL